MLVPRLNPSFKSFSAVSDRSLWFGACFFHRQPCEPLGSPQRSFFANDLKGPAVERGHRLRVSGAMPQLRVSSAASGEQLLTAALEEAFSCFF